MRFWQARVLVDFEVVEPLHVGSGLTSLQEENGEEYELRLLQRANGQAVWLPGSSLKGALRDIAKTRLATRRPEELFGPDTDKISDSACQSYVTVYGAAAKGGQVFTEKRTAIHSGTGAAKDTRLFAREMLDKGAVLTSEFLIHAENETNLRRILDDIGICLGAFAEADGFSIGADKAKGAGRLKILDGAKYHTAQFTSDGWNVGASMPLAIESTKRESELVLAMSCPGPYLVKGSVYNEPIPGDRDGGTREVQMPDRDINGLPRIKGSGIAGALRDRARWLIALNPGLKGQEKVNTTNGTIDLGVVERVFGEEGYRGRIKIWTSNIQKKGASRHPSVRLDPLTQAPFVGGGEGETGGGALFLIEADYGVTFDLHFDWFRSPKDDEKALLAALKEDIDEHGLKLGHGTTKGFGWFNCEPTKPQHTFRKFPQEGFPRLLASSKDLTKDQLSRAPHSRVTLPWRTIETDLDSIAFPEEPVATYQQQKQLHSTQLEEGMSGFIDVSWVFETPVLIGDGGAVRRPQKVGATYVLPGSTIRGYVRSVLTSMANTRLPKINDAQRSAQDAGDRLGTFPLRSEIDWINRRGGDQVENPHNPARDSEFRPDFVEALLGFIQEPDDGEQLDHDKSHLKSRVSFGFANCITPAKLSGQKKTQLLGPNVTSKLYDQVATKFYPPHHGGTAQAYGRLPGPPPDGDPKLSTLQFLEPDTPLGMSRDEAQKLVFRGRISFHNVTLAEYGALVWVLTCAATPSGRHLLGTGRPFGFGKCYCADFVFKTRSNSGAASEPLPEPLGEQLLASGDNFVPSFLAFTDYLKSLGRYGPDLDKGPHGAHEARLRFNARYGQHLRDKSHLDAEQAGHQTAQQIAGVRGGEGAKARISDELQEIRDHNGGRLAALIRRAPGED
jgi:CRISPR/Cas system CSM-associated protein Csm3 (group 7 of RAMP superfamily)